MIGGRQQDAKRAAGGDNPGREAAGIAALRISGIPAMPMAEQVAGRRSRHGGEQRAGEDIGDAEPTRNPVHPGMNAPNRDPAPARELPIAAPFRMNSGIDSSVILAISS